MPRNSPHIDDENAAGAPELLPLPPLSVLTPPAPPPPVPPPMPPLHDVTPPGYLPSPAALVASASAQGAPALSPLREKRCGWCATTTSSQWRMGQTDGSPEFGVLCNACGINYRRARKKARGQVNLDELARSVGSISPTSRPSIHKTLKRQRAAAATAANELAAAEATVAASSTPSSSSRKRPREPQTQALPPFETLVRHLPENQRNQSDSRPP